MKRFMTKVRAIARVASVGLGVFIVVTTSRVIAATSPGASTVCEGITTAGGACTGGTTEINNVLALAVNILSAIAGIIAVTMIIVAGVKYATSQGDAGQIKSAKNTLLYAVVGIIVAALAQFIVHFVLYKTEETTMLIQRFVA